MKYMSDYKNQASIIFAAKTKKNPETPGSGKKQRRDFVEMHLKGGRVVEGLFQIIIWHFDWNSLLRFVDMTCVPTKENHIDKHEQTFLFYKNVFIWNCHSRHMYHTCRLNIKLMHLNKKVSKVQEISWFFLFLRLRWFLAKIINILDFIDRSITIFYPRQSIKILHW